MPVLFKATLLALTFLFFAPANLHAAPNLRVRMSLYQLTHNEEAYAPAGTEHFSVKSGSVRLSYFILENTGNSTLTFTAPTVLLGDGVNHFTIVQDRPNTILAGQSAQMVVKYQPNAVGEHDATLALTSDAPAPLFSINFKGHCESNPVTGMSDLTIQNPTKLKRKCNKSGACKVLAKLEIVNLSLNESIAPGMYLWVANENGFINKSTNIMGVDFIKKAKARKSFSDPPKVSKAKLKLPVLPEVTKFVVFLYPEFGDVQLADNFILLDFSI